MSSTQKTVIALALSFLLPVFIAWAYFSYTSQNGSQTKVNYGRLLDPILTTERSHFKLDDGSLLPKKWTLTYVNFNNHCDKKCQDLTENLKRVRNLMNEDVQRVQTLLVSNDANITPSLKKGLLQMPSNPAAFDTFVSSQWADKKDTILLLDPLGNIVLQYPTENLNIKRMHKDLLRLLKYSRIG